MFLLLCDRDHQPGARENDTNCPPTCSENMSVVPEMGRPKKVDFVGIGSCLL